MTKQVYMRLPDASAVAAPLLAPLRQRSNVTVLAGCQVTALLGSDYVEQLAIIQDGEESFVPADAVFADLGLLPRSEIVRRIAVVDPDGFIVVDGYHATNVPACLLPACQHRVHGSDRDPAR